MSSKGYNRNYIITYGCNFITITTLEAKMLQKIIREKIRDQDLSLREAAQVIGVSHTTLARVINGDKADLETVVAISNWLGVSVAEALNVLGTGEAEMLSAVSMIVKSNPELNNLFWNAVTYVKQGTLEVDELRDIIGYALYKINTSRRKYAAPGDKIPDRD
jgi:transcriptional regulator with XRE-family HTH domain